MNEQPCPRAYRIADRIISEFPEAASEREQIARMTHEEIKAYRPIGAFAQSLKETLVRIIKSSDPYAELRQIAKAVGVPISN